MIIKKGEKEFDVIETDEMWLVSRDEGRVSVSYKVMKDDCPTFDQLQLFINATMLY
ncbi:MAG: hypothetical protein RR107_02600 [Clostridia bacterium]